MSAQFTIPLQTVIPGQLIASSLWNGEWANLNTNFIPAGMDSYSDTDAQMQIQTAPFPGSVTSHASSLGGEIERIRYQISAIIGKTYWYNAPTVSIETMQSSLVPVGGVIDYPVATAPNANYHLANGTAIDRTIYATLFSLIGTTFGIGDGTLTFNLPDYRDRMSIGAGTSYAVAATGGATQQTLAKNQIPSGLLTLNDPGHTHTITDPNHSHGVTDPGHTHIERGATSGVASTHVLVSGTNGAQLSASDSPDSTKSATTGVTVNSGSTGITGANSNTTGASLTDNGGGTPVNILNPYLSMYKMIRVL